MVSKVNLESKEVKVKFMDPNYPSNSYEQPTHDDVCWVPQTHLLVTLETPFTSSISARQYHLSKKDTKTIEYLIN